MATNSALNDNFNIRKNRSEDEPDLLKYKLIADMSSEMISIANREGEIIWINKQFKELTEYSHQDILGEKLGEFLIGEGTHVETIRQLNQAIIQGIEFRGETVIYSRSGKSFWTDLKIVPITESGSVTGFISLQSNISSIKALVKEMLDSQNILKTILDVAPFYVSVKNPDGDYLYFNKSFETDFLNDSDPDSESLINASSQIFLNKNQISYEHKKKINGKNRQLLTYKCPLEKSDGKATDVVTISMDITDRKIVQRGIREREELYSSTMQTIGDAVISVNKEFRIAYMNPVAERLTGYRLAEAKDCLYNDVVKLKNKPSTDEYVNLLVCELNGSFEMMNGRMTLHTRDHGEVIVGEGRVSERFDYAGEFAGLVLHFRDLTDKVEREKLEEQVELKKLAASIEGQEQERSRIAKELHDGLGQMLNLVKMKVDTEIPSQQDGDGLSKLIHEIIQEIKRIAYNLSPTKLRDFPLPTALNSLCKELEKTYCVTIDLITVGDTDSISEINKIHLYRIAQESINNVLKHAKAANIIVSLYEDAENILLSIEDDGLGFNMIERAKGEFNHGLINMKERTRIMNGTFRMESMEDRGTIIAVEVPK